MNRREFAKGVVGGVALMSAEPADSQTGLRSHAYFVDSYHGGVRGHMPPGHGATF
jgi:hypothetical protein